MDNKIEPLNAYYSMAIDDDDLLDCFVNLPSSEDIPFVLDYERIANAQLRDARLQHLAQHNQQQFARQLLAPDTQVYCYIPNPGAPDSSWKVYLPDEILQKAISWYHLALRHVGMSRLCDTMSIHF